MKSLYNFARQKIHSPYAGYALALLMFIEAFFIMPANTLLMVYGIERPNRIFMFATIALVASVLGGIFAYSLGMLLWHAGGETVIYKLLSPETVTNFATKYRENQVWTVFTLSLLPVPYKFITYTAGFFQLPFLPFVACIAAARCIRFYLVAAGMYFFGEKIQHLIDRYFYIFVALTISLIIYTFWKLGH